MANRLLDLKQSKTAALDSAQGILATMEAEKRTAMTKEEDAAFKGFEAEAEGIQKTIEATERMATLAPVSNIPSDQRGGPRTEVHDNVLDKPWVDDEPTAESKEQRMARMSRGMGAFMFEVKNAALKQISGQKGDLRLYALNEGFERRAAAAGASEAVPSDGGFLLFPTFAQELLQLAHETGLIYGRVRKLPLNEFTASIKIPAVDEQSRKDGFRNGGVQMFWEQEAQALTGSRPTFAQLEMVLKKLTGLFYTTNELLADQNLLGNYIMTAFSQEFGFKLDDAMIRGTGAGQPLGILNSNCLVKITKETGQAAQTVVWENIKKAWGRMWSKSRLNSVWFINQDVEQQLYGMGQVVGVGGLPVYLPPTGAAGTPYATLFGRPVMPIEQASTLGTVGDVMLCDFSQQLMIDKSDLQTATSMHVRFLTDELVYRWIYRTDSQPWWKTSLTPAQGSATQSPFVVLDTR